MPRSAVPSNAQVEMLLESLEERRWLATGHARTSHARDLTRAAWKDVAVKLNSDGSGCIKSWQQWAKPFENEPGPSVIADTPEAQDAMVVSMQDIENINEIPQTPESVSILQSHVQIAVEATTPAAVLPQTEQSTPTLPDVQPGPSWYSNNAVSPRTDIPHRNNAPMATSSPRRRRLVTARRRLINRSPPSQRRSHLASLTERFVAIEEKRIDNERLLIDNQQKMLEVFKEISESWLRQTQALHDLCTSISGRNGMPGT